MRVTVVLRGVPAAEGELEEDGLVWTGDLRPLPGFAPVREALAGLLAAATHGGNMLEQPPELRAVEAEQAASARLRALFEECELFDERGGRLAAAAVFLDQPPEFPECDVMATVFFAEDGAPVPANLPPRDRALGFIEARVHCDRCGEQPATRVFSLQAAGNPATLGERGWCDACYETLYPEHAAEIRRADAEAERRARAGYYATHPIDVEHARRDLRRAEGPGTPEEVARRTTAWADWLAGWAEARGTVLPDDLRAAVTRYRGHAPSSRSPRGRTGPARP